MSELRPESVVFKNVLPVLQDRDPFITTASDCPIAHPGGIRLRCLVHLVRIPDLSSRGSPIMESIVETVNSEPCWVGHCGRRGVWWRCLDRDGRIPCMAPLPETPISPVDMA